MNRQIFLTQTQLQFKSRFPWLILMWRDLEKSYQVVEWNRDMLFAANCPESWVTFFVTYQLFRSLSLSMSALGSTTRESFGNPGARTALNIFQKISLAWSRIYSESKIFKFGPLPKVLNGQIQDNTPGTYGNHLMNQTNDSSKSQRVLAMLRQDVSFSGGFL